MIPAKQNTLPAQASYLRRYPSGRAFALAHGFALIGKSVSLNLARPLIAHTLSDPRSAEAQRGGFANRLFVQIGMVLRAAPRETDAKHLRLAAPATRNVAGLGLVLSHP